MRHDFICLGEPLQDNTRMTTHFDRSFAGAVFLFGTCEAFFVRSFATTAMHAPAIAALVAA